MDYDSEDRLLSQKRDHIIFLKGKERQLNNMTKERSEQELDKLSNKIKSLELDLQLHCKQTKKHGMIYSCNIDQYDKEIFRCAYCNSIM